MKVITIIFIFLILVLAFLTITTHFYKKTNLKNTFLSIVLSTVIILLSWINMPSIISLPDEYIEKNKALCIVFKWYNTFGIGYIILLDIIISIILTVICTPLFHFDKEKILKKSKVGSEFNEFSKDAKFLKVIGNDLDFLLDDNCGEQREKIKGLGDRCVILCNELVKPTNFCLDSKKEEDIKYINLVELYNELMEKNVNIKCFPKIIDKNNRYQNLKNLLGQIKETDSKKEIKLVTKENKMFKNIDLQHIPIIEILSDEIMEVYSLAKNSVIKCIAVDIGGVAFEGKIDDFYNKLQSEMGIRIDLNASDKVNLNSELSLGKIDIYQFIERKALVKLKESEREKIKKIWNTTWKPCTEVYEILKQLHNNGYEIVFMSNIDSINSNYFKTQNYFSAIPDYKLFFSCEKKVCKPNEESFKNFEKEFNFLPSQILLIDDQSDNINAANKVHWKTLKFDITTTDIEQLVRELEDLSLLSKK